MSAPGERSSDLSRKSEVPNALQNQSVALSEEEREALSEAVADDVQVVAGMLVMSDEATIAAVESILAARLQAQRESIAQQIKARCHHGLLNQRPCLSCARAASIARADTKEHR